MLPPGCVRACPGCRQRDWPEARAALQKQSYLATTLGVWQDCLQPLMMTAPQRRLGYRDKTALHCRWDDGGWRAGLLRRDTLVPIPACPVHSARVRVGLAAVLPHLPDPGSGFNLVYYAQAGAQLTLVLKQASMPNLGWLDADLRERLRAAGIEGLWLQLYPCAGYHKFSKRGWRLIWGEPRSCDTDGSMHGPQSFQQLLADLHAAALARVRGFLAPGPTTPMLDLYCGTGKSLACWLDAGAPTLGVELNGEAIECARHNAPAAALLRGRCELRIPQIEAWLTGRGGPARAYVNPPRNGLDARLTQWLARNLRPSRLAYLSCSAGTLARDLDQFCASGYAVQELQPLDFFPMTHHVEVLALLLRSSA